jgi:hypothetical protein
MGPAGDGTNQGDERMVGADFGVPVRRDHGESVGRQLGGDEPQKEQRRLVTQWRSSRTISSGRPDAARQSIEATASKRRKRACSGSSSGAAGAAGKRLASSGSKRRTSAAPGPAVAASTSSSTSDV